MVSQKPLKKLKNLERKFLKVGKTTKDKKKHFKYYIFRKKIAYKCPVKAILHVLKQFSDEKIGRTAKKHGGSVKLILDNRLSTRDYAVNAPRRLSAHIRLEFVA